ncbi:MAG TPA: DUF1329 domain-containing protein [Candidatus Binataceae bacterium]|nr:DUF1329 domain-containing protein [Candidatus Binataceae bacterium]
MPKPRTLGTVFISVAISILLGSVAHAEIKPGQMINAQNAALVKDYVSPGVFYRIKMGMSMEIIPTSQVNWPPPYKEASERYSGQVRLSADHRSLLGYVAGQPFALLDPNDPDIAAKIIWNNVFRPITTDDYDLRFFDCQQQYPKLGGAHRVINDMEVGHYAGYNLVGRTEVEPLPADPDFNISGRLWLFALYPVLAPEDQRGVGIIRYRYADPNRGDDSWTWQAGARRVRRLDEAILSSNTGTVAFDPDHYSGYNPKTENYDYKYLGEQMMLACVHAKHSPEVTCPTDAGASACPEDWEMRHIYIVESTPRSGGALTTNVLESRTVIYLDSEVWFEPYVDMYDRKNQLWKNNLYWLAFRDRPVPDAKVAIYPFKREFVVGSSALDEQGGLSSMCYLPGQTTPERECWYINMGAIDKEFCTVRAMVSAAP